MPNKGRLRDQRQVQTYEVDCPHGCSDDYLLVTLERSTSVDSEILVSIERVSRARQLASVPTGDD